MEESRYYSVLGNNDTMVEATERQQDAGDGAKLVDSKDPTKVQDRDKQQKQGQQQPQLEEKGDAAVAIAAKGNCHEEASSKEQRNKFALAGADAGPIVSRLRFDENSPTADVGADDNSPGHDEVLMQPTVDERAAKVDAKDMQPMPTQIKTRVDRFVEHFGAGGAPSPIKPLRGIEAANGADADSQESLDLKISNTFMVPPLGAVVSKCIQQNDSQMSADQQSNLNVTDLQQDATMPSVVEEKVNLPEAEHSGDDVEKDSARLITDVKDKDLLSRKRSQTEMEPAAFELPRATKFPHKDFPALPEFRSDSSPLITFGDGHEGVFQPRLSSRDACIQNVVSFEEDMSIQEISAHIGDEAVANAEEKKACSSASAPSKDDKIPVAEHGLPDNDAETPSQSKACTNAIAEEESEEAQSPSADMNKTSADYFNKTLDMTLRTSGIGACGLGMLLAFDEMLDPAVSPLLPYGLRRRGANVVIFVTTIVLAVLFWFLAL